MYKKNITINLLLLIFISQTLTAQFDYKTIEDNSSLKGPVYLYKETVLEDFTEKFGEYVAETKEISNWYIYDKAGRKTFESKFRKLDLNVSEIDRYIYYFNNDKLISQAHSSAMFKKGGKRKNKFDNVYFSNYKYPQKNIMEKYALFGKKYKKTSTKKYNAKNLITEASENLGVKYGYKELYKYDNNGKTTSYIKYNGIGDLQQKIVYKRNNKGDLIEKNEYSSDGKLLSKGKFEYNSVGEETKVIWYKADGTIDWGYEHEYKNDTLRIKTKSFSGNEKNIRFLIHSEYNKNNLLIKTTYLIWDFKKKEEYITFNYDNNENRISAKTYKNEKLTEKSIYSNYIGKQNLSSLHEEYNKDGSIKELSTYKNDKYGNIIAYERYKFETKFGEKKKIPVKKYKIDIAYHDGTPKLKVKMQIVEEKRKNSNGKKIKENYLKIKIENATEKPTMHFYDKPGTTSYGSNTKKNKHIKNYSYSFQYDYIKRFYSPYFIVEAGNEVVLIKVP